MMVENTVCPTCGLESPTGLCPRCLLQIGLAGESFDRDGGSAGAPAEQDAAAREFQRRAGRPGGAIEILDEIARGGMGVIFRGHDPELDREVAVKVLREGHRDHPDLVRRFVAEARIAGGLQHPGIVPVHELGALADERPYFAMKLIRGRTLAQILGVRTGQGDEGARLLSIFLQVVQAVSYAHSRGVIHRDLTPSNIMVGEYGEVQVMDWGLARDLLRDIGTDVDADSGMGTPGYMAPEQVSRGGARPDERADVFGLGAILCQILTGRPPYAGETSREVREKAARGDLGEAHARLAASEADPELIDLARDCLAFDPIARPRDAGAVAARLSAHLDGVRARLRASEARSRRRLSVALVATMLALVAVAGGGLAWYGHYRDLGRSRAELALREVELLRAEAAADPGGDPARWRAAADALRRADLLLAAVRSTSPGSRRGALGRQIIEGLAQAKADQRLLRRLDVARNGADVPDVRLEDAAYINIFGGAGLDPDQRDPASVGRDLARRPALVKRELIEALENWAVVRTRLAERRAESSTSARLLEAVRIADPDPWRNTLRAMLERRDRTGLLQIAQASDLDRRPPRSLFLLGRLLWWSGHLRLAGKTLEQAWRGDPGDFRINLALALVMTALTPRQEQALAYATSSVALRPDSSPARNTLGVVYLDLKDLAHAEQEFRIAIRLKPDDGWPHANLAAALERQGRFAETLPELRKTMELFNGQGRVDLGNALVNLGRLEEAEAELRGATEARPGQFRAWYFLALARIRRENPEGAAEALDRASALAGPSAKSASQVASARERLKRLQRLPDVLNGAVRLTTSAERVAFARLCGDLGRTAAAAELYAAALETDATLASNRVALHRERAARVAAQAGSGQSRDTPPPDDVRRARLRGQALAWMRAELDAWSAQLTKGAPEARQPAARNVRRWLTEPDLTGVRGPTSIDALPADERDAWRDLWADVDDFLSRSGPAPAGGSTPEPG